MVELLTIVYVMGFTTFMATLHCSYLNATCKWIKGHDYKKLTMIKYILKLKLACSLNGM
jgi:hypothetical protein